MTVLTRIHVDALEILDDEAYFGGGLFTGIAFTARGSVVYDARRL